LGAACKIVDKFQLEGCTGHHDIETPAYSPSTCRLLGLWEETPEVRNPTKENNERVLEETISSNSHQVLEGR